MTWRMRARSAGASLRIAEVAITCEAIAWMIASSLRVGYTPNSAGLDHPADRRRFPLWAERRGIKWEVAQIGRPYDVLVVTPRADIDVCLQRSTRATKLVFDLVDSYLDVPKWTPKQLGRGPAKYLAGESSTPFYSYGRALERMIQAADAVTCASVEQAERIHRLNRNVHPILDIQTKLVRAVKTTYDADKPFMLVWEGLGTNAKWFRGIAEALAEVARSEDVALNLITSWEYHEYVQRFRRRRVIADLRGVHPDIRIYQWSERMVSPIATACDLAVIPLPLDSAFERAKPESKLITFWLMGVPVVTSATPAYSRVMREAELDSTCDTSAEWVHHLTSMIADERRRAEAGRKGREFALEHYSETTLLRRWDTVFESL
jgi:hypothetical protein